MPAAANTGIHWKISSSSPTPRFKIYSLQTGNLLMYILGWGLPWRLTTLPGALIPILPILFLALLPETPTWLLGKGRREDALQSLARYISDVNNILVLFLDIVLLWIQEDFQEMIFSFKASRSCSGQLSHQGGNEVFTFNCFSLPLEIVLLAPQVL